MVMRLKLLEDMFGASSQELRIMMLMDEDFFDENISDNEDCGEIEVNEAAMEKLQEITASSTANVYVSIDKVAKVLHLDERRFRGFVVKNKKDLKVQQDKFIAMSSSKTLVSLLNASLELETMRKKDAGAFMPHPSEPDKIDEKSAAIETAPVEEVIPEDKPKEEKKKTTRKKKKPDPVEAKDEKEPEKTSVPSPESETESKAKLEDILEGSVKMDPYSARKIVIKTNAVPMEKLIFMVDEEVTEFVGKTYVAVTINGKELLVKKEALLSISGSVFITD